MWDSLGSLVSRGGRTLGSDSFGSDSCFPDKYSTGAWDQDLFVCAALENAKSVSTPGTSARTSKELDGEPLARDDYRRFRTVLGKAMWLAQERVDISYACKEVAREMGKPTQGSWEQLKRLVRYLGGLWIPNRS